MEKEKSQERLEKIVEKNRPASVLPRVVAGLGIWFVSTTFDYGVFDDILRLGGAGYMGWGLGGLVSYSVAKSALKRLYPPHPENKEDKSDVHKKGL